MSMFSHLKESPELVTGALARWVRFHGRTLRVRTVDAQGILTRDLEPTIFSVWHNRLYLLPALVPAHIRPRTAILASRSRDGGYMASFLESFGFTVIRGSSSKGGLRAMVQLKRHMTEGGHVAITPDGPRGPKYSIQPGIVWLAHQTQADLIPVSVNAKWKLVLRNWDATEIPWLFSPVEFRLGDALKVTAQTEAESERVRQAMLAITGPWPQNQDLADPQ